jgi:hypothetical protein
MMILKTSGRRAVPLGANIAPIEQTAWLTLSAQVGNLGEGTLFDELDSNTNT